MKINFLYHAEAVAASGYVTLPVQDVMPVQAAAAVPIIGGHSSASVSNFRHGNFLSFARAESHVVGSYSAKDKAHGTLSSTTIEGLNIMDVVTCDRIVARLTTKHPEAGEASFSPLGSRFENLRIAGHVIQVDLATDLFATHDTWNKLNDAHAKDPGVKGDITKMAVSKGTGSGFPASNGMMWCTLARNLNQLPGGLTRRDHGIYVPHFGTVYLGEYFVSASEHRLLMLRSE